jgi:hypothetical protein
VVLVDARGGRRVGAASEGACEDDVVARGASSRWMRASPRACSDGDGSGDGDVSVLGSTDEVDGTRVCSRSDATDRSPPPVTDTSATVPTASMSMTTHAVARLTVLIRMGDPPISMTAPP